MHDDLVGGSVRWWRRAVAVLSVLVALMFAAVVGVIPGFAPAAPPVTVGVVPPWDAERGMADLDRHAGQLTQVAPWWFRPVASGEVRMIGDRAALEDVVDIARRHDQKVVPMVTNFQDGAWDADLVGAVLADARAVAVHVAAVTELVVEGGYDGIHLDYRDLAPRDADRYADLVRRIATSLDTHGKLTAVSVQAQTHADDPASRAHDYARLGEWVEQLHVLALDHHWRTPGPLAPIGWVDEVAGYASSVVPPERVILSVGVHGRVWGPDGPETLTLEQVADRIDGHPSAPGFDPQSASPFLEGADVHEWTELWFEDEESLRRKFAVVDRHGLGGVLLWRLGGTVPAVWDTLDDELGPVTP